VISYILLLWNYYAFSTISLIYSIIIIAFLGLSYFLLKPFYEAIDKRIGIAPNWLVKLSVHPHNYGLCEQIQRGQMANI